MEALDGGGVRLGSLSARRAWIEMSRAGDRAAPHAMVALRKESVDRNFFTCVGVGDSHVALRKESVDRNNFGRLHYNICFVALRKESVDRNPYIPLAKVRHCESLSARRAWIEILYYLHDLVPQYVALRKESVDRNGRITNVFSGLKVALRKESVDRNICKCSSILLL